jgi:tetratricopeptide (TPR) repeat protein
MVARARDDQAGRRAGSVGLIDETQASEIDARGAAAAALELDRTLASEVAPAEGVARGSVVSPRLGRYVVLEALGEGGMGIVYAAYDPELDRRVAIKLLRAGHGDPEARLRLLREAQAMARLSHPNVVAIYDVGTFDGQVFMALELVRGRSVGDWLKVSKRTWPEVLEIFVAAGRGLAAAHAVGLVHRDFKPDNVLIADDGAVKVMDFGLARAEAGRGEASGLSGPHEGKTLDLELTRAGARMGTPAFMAPEQHLGGAVDARTDVFAFCVALYLGVYGDYPFPTDSWASLQAAVLDGAVRAPPAGVKAPQWLERALRRGLQLRPEDRWQSMGALLEELTRERGRRRRRLALGGLAVAATLGLLSLRGEDEGARICGGAAAEIAATWGEEQRAAVDAALRATGASFAGQTAIRSLAALDAYADAWVEARAAACWAHQRRELSEELYDLELACLSRRQREMAARVAVLAAADAEVAQEAVRAVSSLPELDSCSDPARLRAPYEPPAAAARELVEALGAQLAAARAQGEGGRPRRGYELATAASAAAEALGYPPILAEALVTQGSLEVLTGAYSAAEVSLGRAWWTALGARHDEAAATAAVALIAVVGRRLGRAEEGVVWARHAEAMLTRRGALDRLQALRLENLAALHQGQARYAEALRDLDEASDVYRRVLPPAHPTFAELAAKRGDALRGLGRAEEALVELEAARSALEAAYGADHPRVAATLNNLGAAYTAAGELGPAKAALERALVIEEAALGAEHPDVAATLNNLAIVLMKRAEVDAAEVALDRAIAIRGREAADPALSDALLNRGSLRLQRGQRALALVDYERALVNDLTIFGEQHPNVAITRNNLGFLLWTAGRSQDAKRELEAALVGLEGALGAEHPLLAAPLLGLAQVALDLGDAAGALLRLQRAEAVVSGWSAGEMARLEFARARARWELSSGAAAAVEAGAAALAAYHTIEAAGEPLADSARWSRAWLVRRGLLAD